MNTPCRSLVRVSFRNEWALFCAAYEESVDRLQECCFDCRQYIPGDGSIGIVQKIPLDMISK